MISADKRGESEYSAFKLYKIFIQREKEIYVNLNMFKSRPDSPHIITGLAWCPTSKNLEAKMSQIRTAKNFKGLIFEKLNIEGLNLTRPTSF